MKIVLASNSPRRKELLEMANIPFRVFTNNVDETHPEGISPKDLPLALAQKKGNAVRQEVAIDEVVIAADTIVLLGEEILEKPTDENDAILMIGKLSGCIHEVITGVFMYWGEKEISFSETTHVHFNTLTEEEIRFYVEKFKPYDKAGSYACQEWIGAVGISRFEGDYFNVVGLPINKVYQTLKSWGYRNNL